MLPNYKSVLVLFSILVLLSCSGGKKVSRDQLRSDFLAAISLTSETGLFIDQMQAARAPSSFSDGHLDYLREEAKRSANELAESSTEIQMANQLETCRTQLSALAAVLADVKKAAAKKNEFLVAKHEVSRIRAILEEANTSL